MHDSGWRERGQTNQPEVGGQRSSKPLDVIACGDGGGIGKKRSGDSLNLGDLLANELRRAAPAEGPEPPDLFSPLSAGQGKKLYAALSPLRINS